MRIIGAERAPDLWHEAHRSWGTGMRFTISDWLRLILTCTTASAAMVGLGWAVWAAICYRGKCFPNSPPNPEAVGLALSLLAMPLNALASWPVLRRCVNGLRLAPWLTETALGAVLGGIVSLPAVFLVCVSGGAFPMAGAKAPSAVGWLQPIACAVAALLPPGLLLQRLSGASAWPPLLIVGAAMALILLVWGQTPTQFLLPYEMLFTNTFFVPGTLVFGITAVAFVGMSGVLTGLVLGAGLFLMARLSRAAIAR
jgi:hypothetical protein